MSCGHHRREVQQLLTLEAITLVMMQKTNATVAT
jgi:hypothetical protein